MFYVTTLVGFPESEKNGSCAVNEKQKREEVRLDVRLQLGLGLGLGLGKWEDVGLDVRLFAGLVDCRLNHRDHLFWFTL